MLIISQHPETLRCGTDLCDIERIRRAVDRLGPRFLERVFTAAERADCLPGGQLTAGSAASLAARFAAKEAVAKALGTGIWRQGITWTDIAVRRNEDGSPAIELSGAALARYESIGGSSLAISLTHDRGLAMAFCVLQGRSAAKGQVSHG